jgi:hypothetical protein
MTMADPALQNCNFQFFQRASQVAAMTAAFLYHCKYLVLADQRTFARFSKRVVFDVRNNRFVPFRQSEILGGNASTKTGSSNKSFSICRRASSAGRLAICFFPFRLPTGRRRLKFGAANLPPPRSANWQNGRYHTTLDL